jgi:hypothetical protein
MRGMPEELPADAGGRENMLAKGVCYLRLKHKLDSGLKPAP